MRILFFKARPENPSDRDRSEDKEPLPDKIRRILISHVKDAKTREEREHADEQLHKLNAGAAV